MEVDTIYYRAKDGKLFTDPLECENYEKKLGVIPGSVADIISYLNEQCKPESYLHGLVYVLEPDGSKSLYQCTTVCVANKLDSFVNIENLNTDQLFIATKVKDVIEWLGRCDKDCPVHYFLCYSKNIDMSDCGVITLYNPKVWKQTK